MVNRIHQQEILITSNSSFLSKVYFDKCDAGSSDIFIEFQKIEEACWNGLLEEVLPEIFTLDIYAKPIFVWKIREYNSIMEIDMGEYPLGIDNYFCIDPYKFISNRSNKLNN